MTSFDTLLVSSAMNTYLDVKLEYVVCLMVFIEYVLQIPISQGSGSLWMVNNLWFHKFTFVYNLGYHSTVVDVICTCIIAHITFFFTLCISRVRLTD